jgi:dipeptidyl aminopeptidase/acylaminoacyl peptidase
VLGTSYGAFLALLAAAVDPALWTGCVAIAPFLSGPRLYPVANAPTRLLLERLGGLAVPSVEGRSCDVLDRCRDIRGPVLLVHGTDDDVIPVEQSRLLHRRLVELGHSSVHLLDLPGTGHDPVAGPHQKVVLERVLRFCQAAAPSPGTASIPQLEHAERR